MVYQTVCLKTRADKWLSRTGRKRNDNIPECRVGLEFDLMNKPVIAVTPQLNMGEKEMRMNPAYFEALEDAGGVPVMLSIKSGEAEIDDLLEHVHGVMLPGGGDVYPGLYGEDVSEHCGETIPALDALEITLVRAAYKRGLPIFGICRGCQVINVALGGTLVQDIPALAKRDRPILHSQDKLVPVDYPSHAVTIYPDSRLFACLGQERVDVNSFHHQCILQVAPGMLVTAWSDDGLTEAAESGDPERFLLAIQWHPERMFKRDENARKLFRSFVENAAKRA